MDVVRAAPWDRQPGESAHDYERFTTWLKAPEGTTLAGHARSLGLHPQSLYRPARRHSWRARKAAYLRSIVEAQRALGAAEWHETHKKQAAAWDMLLDHCITQMEGILTRQEQVTASELARILKMVTEAQRLMEGLSTERKELDLSGLSLDKLDQMDALLREAEEKGSTALH